MSARKDSRKLPTYVRKSQDEAADFDLDADYVYICDKCNLYMLNEETAFNHKKCTKRPLPISKNVTDPVKHNLLQSIEQKLSVMKNNKIDGATKNYKDVPSTSSTNTSSTSVCAELKNQNNYTLVCTDDQSVDVVDGCSLILKTTLDNQPEQNPITSTPLEELLKVSTTSVFTKEISEHINKPTTQCLSSCSLIESFMNDINFLKKKCGELEESVNNLTVDVDTLKKEKDYYKSLINMPENRKKAEDDNNDSIKKQNELKEEIFCLLKSKIREL